MSVVITEYVFLNEETQNVVVFSARNKGNSKTTGKDPVPMLETLNYSLDAVLANDMKLDAGSCGDCPRSYNQGAEYGQACYCHKGHERFALVAKLKKLHKMWLAGDIQPFTTIGFEDWWTRATEFHSFAMCRFGRYGDPFFVGQQPNELLFARLMEHNAGMTTTGYTHQWRKPGAEYLKDMMMASVDTLADFAEADQAGWRKYIAVTREEATSVRDLFGASVKQCPASKQARERQGEKKVTCLDCSGCSGLAGATTHDFFIINH